MASGYRERQSAMHDRLSELRGRLRRLDVEVDAAPSSRRLARKLRVKLSDLRGQAEPSNDTVQALVAAESAADDYERNVDEALGLDAELRKSFDPLVPRKEVLARWAGFAVLSLGMMYATVHQMGLDDFMLRAIGVKVQRAATELSSEPLRHSAITAAPCFLPSVGPVPASSAEGRK